MTFQKITNVILDRQGEIIGLIVKKKKSYKTKQNTHVQLNEEKHGVLRDQDLSVPWDMLYVGAQLLKISNRAL